MEFNYTSLYERDSKDVYEIAKNKTQVLNQLRSLEVEILKKQKPLLKPQEYNTLFSIIQFRNDLNDIIKLIEMCKIESDKPMISYEVLDLLDFLQKGFTKDKENIKKVYKFETNLQDIIDVYDRMIELVKELVGLNHEETPVTEFGLFQKIFPLKNDQYWESIIFQDILSGIKFSNFLDKIVYFNKVLKDDQDTEIILKFILLRNSGAKGKLKLVDEILELHKNMKYPFQSQIKNFLGLHEYRENLYDIVYLQENPFIKDIFRIETIKSIISKNNLECAIPESYNGNIYDMQLPYEMRNLLISMEGCNENNQSKQLENSIHKFIGDYRKQVHNFIKDFPCKREYLIKIDDQLLDKIKVPTMDSNPFGLLKKDLKIKFPHSQVYRYGSSVNGIYSESSDFDVCLCLQDYFKTDEERTEVVNFLKKLNYQNVTPIFRARIPIIKFKNPKGTHNFDLCFNNELAIVNSRLLKEYTSVDPRVKQLMYLVKIWSGVKNINVSSDGTFSSYALNNMVIQFLQTLSPPILPNLQDIDYYQSRSSTIKIISNPKCNGMSTNFILASSIPEKDFNPILNPLTIGQLFYEFFKFYSLFDFENQLINIRFGKLTQRSDIVPEFQARFKNSIFCVQDPLDLNINTTFGIKCRFFLYEFYWMENRLRLFCHLQRNSMVPNFVEDLFEKTNFYKFLKILN
eukprot:gene6718-8328_t